MNHVFISYTRKDQEYARALAADLRQHSFDVWMDNRIDYGAIWWREIARAIEDCSAVLVVMSPDSEASPWVEREVEMTQRAGKPILPLLLGGDPFPQLAGDHPITVRDGRVPGAEFYERLMQIQPPKGQPGRLVTPTPPSVMTKPLPPADRYRLEEAVKAAERNKRMRSLAVVILAALLVLAGLVMVLVLLNQSPASPGLLLGL